MLNSINKTISIILLPSLLIVSPMVFANKDYEACKGSLIKVVANSGSTKLVVENASAYNHVFNVISSKASHNQQDIEFQYTYNKGDGASGTIHVLICEDNAYCNANDENYVGYIKLHYDYFINDNNECITFKGNDTPVPNLHDGGQDTAHSVSVGNSFGSNGTSDIYYFN